MRGGVGFKPPADQVLGVEDSDDVVGTAAINRHARKVAVNDLREELVGRRVDIEHEDAIARRHDVADAARPNSKTRWIIARSEGSTSP